MPELTERISGDVGFSIAGDGLQSYVLSGVVKIELWPLSTGKMQMVMVRFDEDGDRVVETSDSVEAVLVKDGSYNPFSRANA